SILECNSRIQSRLANTIPPEFQHGFGTIHPKGGDSRKSLHEPNCHIRRPTSKIDYAATRKLRKSLAKIARNPPMGLAPISRGIGRRLFLLVHQFGFGYALHGVTGNSRGPRGQPPRYRGGCPLGPRITNYA